MKVTMIIGEPAVGKSTPMKAFMKSMGNWIYESPKWIPYHVNIKNGKDTIVLGRYDDATHPFPGTDRMSMAVQQHAIQFIINAKNRGANSLFFEGDRLGNDKMLKALQYSGVDLEVICLVTNVDRRRPSQTDKFRASRKTKIRNMTGWGGRAAKSGLPVKRLIHDEPVDTQEIVEYLIRERT